MHDVLQVSRKLPREITYASSSQVLVDVRCTWHLCCSLHGIPCCHLQGLHDGIVLIHSSWNFPLYLRAPRCQNSVTIFVTVRSSSSMDAAECTIQGGAHIHVFHVLHAF